MMPVRILIGKVPSLALQGHRATLINIRWNSTENNSGTKTETPGHVDNAAQAAVLPTPTPPPHHPSSPSHVPREVDLDRIQAALAKVNTFAKKKNGGEKSSQVLIYEINAGGIGTYKNMTLKELLGYVNYEAHYLDSGASTITTELSKVVMSGFSSFFGSSAAEAAAHKPEPPKDPHAAHHPHPHHAVFNTGSELSLRDLHRLDYLFNLNEEKSVLVRRHSVLFAMDPVRAIVMANRLLVLAPSENDPLIELIANYMKEWTHHNEHTDLTHTDVAGAHDAQLGPLAKSAKECKEAPVYFETHAYEALLTVVKTLEFQEYDKVKLEVKEVLEYFQTGSLLPIEVQEKMRSLKNDLSMMISRVGSSQRLLKVITEDDEELALMNLTPLRNKPSLYEYPLNSEILSTRDPMQELLESYLIDFNSLCSKVEFLKSQIQSAEELVSLRLDTSRNELLIANTGLAIVGCSIGFAAYLCSLFGMNLDNSAIVPHTVTIFCAVFGGTMFLIPAISTGVYLYFAKRQILPTRTNRFHSKPHHVVHHHVIKPHNHHKITHHATFHHHKHH